MQMNESAPSLDHNASSASHFRFNSRALIVQKNRPSRCFSYWIYGILFLGVSSLISMVMWVTDEEILPEQPAFTPIYAQQNLIPPQDSVILVWRMPGNPTLHSSVIKRELWESFLARYQQTRSISREGVLSAARQEIALALIPVFQEMQARIPNYINWFYSFPTSYRMTFTAIMALFSPTQNESLSSNQIAQQAIEQMLKDRFIDLVVSPEQFQDAVQKSAQTAIRHAVSAEHYLSEVWQQEFTQFIQEQGRPAIATDNAPLLIAAEVMGFAPNEAMLIPPADAGQRIKTAAMLNEITTSNLREAATLVTRQVVRRSVSGTGYDLLTGGVLQTIGPGIFGATEFIISPMVSVASFALGIGAEIGMVKIRRWWDGDQLIADCTIIVKELQEREGRAVTNAVVARIAQWIPDPTLK